MMGLQKDSILVGLGKPKCGELGQMGWEGGGVGDNGFVLGPSCMWGSEDENGDDCSDDLM